MIDTILEGDCLELLPSLPDDSIDAIVTDPPYELTSGNSKKGFMGKAWDGSGIAYNTDMWAECLRVLKPGGHLLAFGGTRTYHRMACAIEDAGFEIRDSIEWVYGSGFPKSLDISKALDKMAGAEREIIGISARHGGGKNFSSFGESLESNSHPDITAPATPAAKQWAGFGTALKPAHEPIVLARKPLSEKTIAANVLRRGCGGLNIDGCRVEGIKRSPEFKNPESELGYHGGSSNKNLVDWDNTKGRFPANLIWSHSPLCMRIGTKKVKGDKRGASGGHRQHDYDSVNAFGDSQHKEGDITPAYGDADGLEEVESWDCHPSCPSWQFAKAGVSKSKSGGLSGSDPGVWQGKKQSARGGHDDQGTPARFFQSCPFTEEDIPAFLYYAKASRSERERGLDGMMKTGRGIAMRSHDPGPFLVRVHDPDSREISEYLREWREKEGLSKTEMDEKLGTVTLYSWFEGRPAGIQLPTPEMWFKLKEILHFDSKHDKEMTETCLQEKSGFSNSLPTKNNHPTVKPLALMRYLCRLITPPGGLILDPFAGSGTTCLAAKQEGFRFIGIEKESEYAEIARRRVASVDLIMHKPLTAFS